METHNYFFSNGMNTISKIEQNVYDEALEDIEPLLDSMTQVSNNGFYIIDYFKQDFLYVSDVLAYWLGIPDNQVKELGYKQYTEHILPEDQAMLREIRESGFKFYETLPEEECKNYSISYDFRIGDTNNSRLINHRLTPLAMHNGKIWLALCSITLSANKEPGHITMKKKKDESYYEYSLDTHKWHAKTEVTLTDIEKNILTLTAQGYTCKEMEAHIHRSVNTVKTYRKQLLKKFNMTNTTSALVYAINNNLL